MATSIAAIDVGTTGARTIIFDLHGKILASAYREYPILTPEPNQVEQDAKLWWSAVVETSQDVLKNVAVDNDEVMAISVTNQRETIVPVTKENEPLYNALVWQDKRTQKQCEFIKKTVGTDEIYKRTGLVIDPYFSAAKILWFKEHKPAMYEKAHKFLLVHDFIVRNLTGEFVTDHSNASRTMLFDINKLEWSDELCGQLDISMDKLPRARPSGELVGGVTSEASAAIGFRQDTPVVTGGGDQQCAALGQGVDREGLINATTGTGTFILAHMNKPMVDPEKRFVCSVSAIPGSYVLEASLFSTGAVYRWYRDNFADTEREQAKKQGINVYEMLNQMVADAEPGARGLLMLPHFAGAGAPYWNPEARGVLYGLTLAHTKNDILRAIIEGICFEVKRSLDIFEALGVSVDEVRISGGATRAEVWNQLQADVYGVPVVKTAHEESTALGAAMIGALGVKLFSSYEDAVKNMVEIAQCYKPGANLHKFYSSIMEKNEKLYRAIFS